MKMQKKKENIGNWMEDKEIKGRKKREMFEGWEKMKWGRKQKKKIYEKNMKMKKKRKRKRKGRRVKGWKK